MVPGTAPPRPNILTSAIPHAELLARTPLSTSADVDAAVQAAADAFPAWAPHSSGERVQYLFRLKNLLEENLDDLARVITLENVRPSLKPAPNSAAPSKTWKSLVASP